MSCSWDTDPSTIVHLIGLATKRYNYYHGLNDTGKYSLNKESLKRAITENWAELVRMVEGRGGRFLDSD